MQRYFAQNKLKNKIELIDSDIYHIKKVMRMKEGQEILAVYEEKTYLCQIKNLDDGELNIVKEIPTSAEMPTEVTVAIGLVKEQKMDVILQKLTELGIKKIIPLTMERSIIKLDKDKINKKQNRWQAICKEASEQSHRSIVPEVFAPIPLSELMKMNFDLKLACSTTEVQNSLKDVMESKNNYEKIVFVIGPEGGLTREEEQYLQAHGYTLVSLGKRILRVETAAIYVASIVSYIMG